MNDFKFMCLDVETTGLDWTTDKLHGIGVGYEEDVAQYYPSWNIPKSVRDNLANPKIAKIGQNLHAFDAKFVQKFGMPINGEFHDTKILAHLIDDQQSLRLKEMAAKYLGEDSLEGKRELDQYLSSNGCGHVGQLCAKDLLHDEHPHLPVIAKYCIEDVNNTTKLFFLFTKKLQEMDRILKSAPFNFKKSPWDYYLEEAMPLERVLFEMEYRGIRVNLKAIHDIRDNALDRMKDIEGTLTKILVNRIPKVEHEIYQMALKKVTTEKAKKKVVAGAGKNKFSWSNNNHFGLLLYKYCDLDAEFIQRTAKGKYQTDKTALGNIKARLDLKHPLQRVLKLFSEYKLCAKIATTYTGTNKKGIISKIRTASDGSARIYPEYQQTTSTGRLKCKNPNMQNLKRDSEVKKFFITDHEDEVFDDADYSQIELRTGAHLSQDRALLEAYIEGKDVHLRTASRLYDREITKADDLERQAGKRTNFLTIFDGGPHRLAACLKSDTGEDFSVEQCKEFIKIWFEIYPGVRAYLDAQLEFFKKYKFCISETGRVRRLPDIIFGKDIKWFKEFDERSGKERWTPKYVGPSKQREDLISRILSENQKLSHRQVTESMIGWEARRWYQHAIKAGYNQPIQGLAASITKRAMIALHAAGRVITNQVHDSLAVPRKRGDLKAHKQVIEIMENTYKLSLPVTVDCKVISSFHPNDKVKEDGI